MQQWNVYSYYSYLESPGKTRFEFWLGRLPSRAAHVNSQDLYWNTLPEYNKEQHMGLSNQMTKYLFSVDPRCDRNEYLFQSDSHSRILVNKTNRFFRWWCILIVLYCTLNPFKSEFEKISEFIFKDIPFINAIMYCIFPKKMNI